MELLETTDSVKDLDLLIGTSFLDACKEFLEQNSNYTYSNVQNPENMMMENQQVRDKFEEKFNEVYKETLITYKSKHYKNCYAAFNKLHFNSLKGTYDLIFNTLNPKEKGKIIISYNSKDEFKIDALNKGFNSLTDEESRNKLIELLKYNKPLKR